MDRRFRRLSCGENPPRIILKRIAIYSPCPVVEIESRTGSECIGNKPASATSVDLVLLRISKLGSFAALFILKFRWFFV
jgi:hypothetical protein